MGRLFRWLLGRPAHIVASGWLSTTPFRWVAVRSRQALAFHDANSRAVNALSFAHYSRGVAARCPHTAERVERTLSEVRELERVYPQCVVFVFVDPDPAE